jgi:hypothetical protein
MPFITPGSNVTQRIVFNAGTLDFGSNRVVELKNATLNLEWTLNTLFVLNTIKPADIARHSQKIELTAKVISFSPEVESLTWGASTPGTPQEIDTLDGQATMTSPVLTLFDRNGKQIQYQLSGAVIKSSKATLAAEEYAEWDFALEAKDMIALYTI